MRSCNPRLIQTLYYIYASNQMSSLVILSYTYIFGKRGRGNTIFTIAILVALSLNFSSRRISQILLSARYAIRAAPKVTRFIISF